MLDKVKTWLEEQECDPDIITKLEEVYLQCKQTNNDFENTYLALLSALYEQNYESSAFIICRIFELLFDTIIKREYAVNFNPEESHGFDYKGTKFETRLDFIRFELGNKPGMHELKNLFMTNFSGALEYNDDIKYFQKCLSDYKHIKPVYADNDELKQKIFGFLNLNPDMLYLHYDFIMKLDIENLSKSEQSYMGTDNLLNKLGVLYYGNEQPVWTIRNNIKAMFKFLDNNLFPFK